ncbi:MAG: hypothetical protein ACPGRY_14630 [Candidatus Latescibacterota bacterium]
MSDVLWQIALTDALLICLVASIGWWFRTWLSRERNDLLQQLETLQKQQQNLEQVCNRLEAVSRSFERMGRRRVEERVENRPTNRNESDDVYARAWERLERGHAAAAVAKELEMGIAEVELLGRMMRQRRQR